LRKWRIDAGIASLILLLAALWLTSGGNDVHAALNDSDDDGVVDIAELLAGSDPHDAGSGPESAGGTIYLNAPLCTDGIDNDDDGVTDAADPGCTDSDGDLVDDPIEVQLGSDPNNFDSIPEDSLIDAILVSFGFITFQCNDGLDNDIDGLVDLADPGCAPYDTDGDGFEDVTEKMSGSDPDDASSRPEDEDAYPGSCSDGRDNDGDGTTDGVDAGCAPATPTVPLPSPTEGPEATVAATGMPGPGEEPSPTAAVRSLPLTGDGSGGADGAATLLAVLVAIVGGSVLGAGLLKKVS
jgi:hypothetical protein